MHTHTRRCAPATTNFHPRGCMSGEGWSSYGSTICGKVTFHPKIFRIVNIMFPRAHFGGDDADSKDENTNFTQASSSSGLRDDTHSNYKRHRTRYFNKTDNKVKRVTDAAHFQDGLNNFKEPRARKILSEVLMITFDNLDEYEEFKDYTDHVLSYDIIKVYSTKDNTDERMAVLDEIMFDIQADRATYLTDFAKQDDFISLASSRISIENLMDDDQHADDGD
jgi:hypothetical protein